MEGKYLTRHLTILCASDIPGGDTKWKTIIKEDVVDQTNIISLTEKVGNISFVTQNMPSGPGHIILEEDCPFWPGPVGLRRNHVGVPEVINALEPETLVVMRRVKVERLRGIGIYSLTKLPVEMQRFILNEGLRTELHPEDIWTVYIKGDHCTATESSGVH